MFQHEENRPKNIDEENRLFLRGLYKHLPKVMIHQGTDNHCLFFLGLPKDLLDLLFGIYIAIATEFHRLGAELASRRSGHMLRSFSGKIGHHKQILRHSNLLHSYLYYVLQI